MRALSTFPQVYLCTSFVDFRKSINGLSQIVEAELSLKPFSGAMFVFMGRRRDRIKILYWDKTGFSLWYKRLEAAKFQWKRGLEEKVVTITVQELEWLLSGVDIWRMKTHPEVSYEKMS